jgi:diguanylate cyclase (GGDEF)-like protein/PAS domain S-box-containing protein
MMKIIDARTLASTNLPAGPPSRLPETPPNERVNPFRKTVELSMGDRTARERVLAAILESEEDAVLSISLDGTIVTWSRGAERLYGYTADEMTGQSLSRLLPLYELQTIEALLAHAAGNGHQTCEKAERLHKNGSRILLTVRRSLIRLKDGEVEGILESARQRDFQPLLATPEENLQRLLMEQMPGLLWTTDRNLRITSNWGVGSSACGIRPGTLAGLSVCEFLRCADRHSTPIAEHGEALRGLSSRFEYDWKNRVLEILVGPLRAASGEISGCLGLAVDVTDRKRTEAQALYHARHDALTGLANYREFMDRLEPEVRRAERSNRSFTLLLLDLDELKRINDLQGHLAGNRALRRLAAIMNEHCRATDVAARYGGDEFAVILIDSDRGMAENVARRIEHRLRTDLEKPSLSVSIGIGVYPDDGRTAAELIEAADRRLYQRKRAQNKRIFTAT